MVAPLTKTMPVKEEEWHTSMNKAIDPVGVRSTYNDNLINSNRNNAIHISCLYSGIEAEELITKIQFSRVSGACMQIFVSFFTFSGQKRGHLYLKTPSPLLLLAKLLTQFFSSFIPPQKWNEIEKSFWGTTSSRVHSVESEPDTHNKKLLVPSLV